MNNQKKFEEQVPYEQFNLSEELRKKVRDAIPGISGATAMKWVHLHYCVGHELALLGINDFWLRPYVDGTGVEVWYKTKKPREAADSEVLKAEMLLVWRKIGSCIADANLKEHKVRPCKKIPPTGGTGGDDPITVMPT